MRAWRLRLLAASSKNLVREENNYNAADKFKPILKKSCSLPSKLKQASLGLLHSQRFGSIAHLQLKFVIPDYLYLYLSGYDSSLLVE